MSDELRIKDLLDLLRLDWFYSEDDESASARFTTDTSDRDAPIHNVRVESVSMDGYQIILNGDELPGYYETRLDAKREVEQQLTKDYPNYGCPQPDPLSVM